MEIIEVNSYTENEKFHIAKEYLVAKQLERNGLKPDQAVFDDETIKKIIHNYTREAGVRSLERKIGDICRKAAREIVEDRDRQKSIHVTTDNLEKYLGKEKISFEDANEEDEVGIVRGLAWTSVGGDTLQIEVNVMPGKGELKMTGQMGDVMKESAQIALSYIRSIASTYGVTEMCIRDRSSTISSDRSAVYLPASTECAGGKSGMSSLCQDICQIAFTSKLVTLFIIYPGARLNLSLIHI